MSAPLHTVDLDSLLTELAEVLVRQSLRYGDFTLASGASSKYYCDTKLTLLSPRGAALCGEALRRVVSACDAEAVGGLAMGAAYMAAGIALASQATTPIYGFTVRPRQKDHGRGQKIDTSWHPDGELLVPGRRVVVVDDVVTTGGSTQQALDGVRETGCEIVAVAAVLDRGAGGAERFAAAGLPFYPLFVADSKGQLSRGLLPAGLE